ncbi:unnamed protein product [Paramecium primaurelia]|uniref:Uncharacterized protein n=1 Tax=Paramecium primaurelia TaxID=5886 RepID=A0A8S1KRG5_PARPR|nr:unnamed protein product [Paramecium primaurelia]
MSQIKQNLRKRQTNQKFGLDLDNKILISQNNVSQRTRRQVVILKQEIKKKNNPLEKETEIQKNAKEVKQVVKGKTKKALKPCLQHEFTKDELFLNDISIDKQKVDNVQNKKIFQNIQSQTGSQKNEESKEQYQNAEQQNFILNLIALQARSELRFELDWKNHDIYNQEISQKNNTLFKIQSDESCDFDSVICYSFFSNDNEKLENCQIKNKNSKDIQKINSKIEKLEEFYSQDLNQVKIEENNHINKDYNKTSQLNLIKTLNDENQQSSIKQNDEPDEINKFYYFLNQATYENPSRRSCKEIHKLIRQRYDKYCVDVLMIDVIWSELQQSKELKVISFQQFLKCIQDMHEQDLLWLDQQGRKVYLI